MTDRNILAHDSVANQTCFVPPRWVDNPAIFKGRYVSLPGSEKPADTGENQPDEPDESDADKQEPEAEPAPAKPAAKAKTSRAKRKPVEPEAAEVADTTSQPADTGENQE